jgi:hypothetical protein
MIPENEQENYETFRDCLSNAIIQRIASEPPKRERRRAKGRKHETARNNSSAAKVESTNAFGGNDAEELGEFIDVQTSHLQLKTNLSN